MGQGSSFSWPRNELLRPTFWKATRMKKNKHKTTCPYGGKFAKDWFHKLQCEKSCKLRIECEEVWEAKYFKVSEDDEDKENDRLKRHSDENEDEKPQSKKHKKHKKKKQDNRGLYIPRPALNKLLALSYHSCMRLYCFYMKEGMRRKTNRPWCNNKFVANGLQCSIGTVVTAKKLLIEAGFIKIVGGGGESGKFKKTYIELKYFTGKYKIENVEYKRRLAKYKRQLDEDVEEFAEWVNVFTSEMMKLEIKLFEAEEKYKNLRRRYRKLK